MVQCKGHCLEWAVKKIAYRRGVKRCSVCEVYFPADHVTCLCCHMKLRSRSRNNKYR